VFRNFSDKIYSSKLYVAMAKVPLHAYILLIFSIILTIIVVSNHYLFRTFAYDYAAYNFGWRDYAHLRLSPNPVYWVSDMSFLQDHLSFLFFILIPFYWLLTPVFGTYSLLLVQNAFIIWGGWGVYKMVSARTTENKWGNYALLLYFVTYGRYSAFTTDVNLMIMLSSLVPVYLYYFEKKNYFVSLILILILLTGRESLPIWLVFVFAVQFIWYKSNKIAIKWLLAFGILSVAYFIVAFYVLIPLVENPNNPFNLFNYSALGKGPAEALVYLITHPLESIRLLFINHTGEAEFNGMKLEFYAVYFASGAFVLLYRPWYFLFFVPIVMQKMYNDSGVRWGIDTYYSIEVVTLLPIAVFLTIHRIQHAKLRKWLPVGIILLAAIVTIHKSDKNNRVLKWYSSDKYKFYDPKMYKSGFDAPAVHRLLGLIPSGASVSASDHLAPHFSHRDTIFYFPRIDNAEYLAVFTNRVSPYFTPEQYYKVINDELFASRWTLVGFVYPVMLVKRNTNIHSHEVHEVYSVQTVVSDTFSVLSIPVFKPTPNDRIRVCFYTSMNSPTPNIFFTNMDDIHFASLYTDTLYTEQKIKYTWDADFNPNIGTTQIQLTVQHNDTTKLLQLNNFTVRAFRLE